MAAIKTNFGEGHANLAPSDQGSPTLATALRDIADDLDGLQVATISTADASDLTTAIALANAIKAAINVTAAVTLKTTKG